MFPKDLKTHPLEPYGWSNRLFFRSACTLVEFLLKCFFAFESSGAPPPDNGPFIIAANHESFLDPIVLQIAVGQRRRLHYMMIDTLYRTRLLNLFSNAMRCIPVRKDGLNKEALSLAREVLRSGQPIGIFPQGGRKDSDDLDGGFQGVAFLARVSRAPVIPARIWNTGQALPRGKRFPRRAPIAVTFGAPITFERSASGTLSLDEMTQAIMTSIAALLPP